MMNTVAECNGPAVDLSSVSSVGEMIGVVAATDAACKTLASIAIFAVAIASGAVPMRIVAQQHAEGGGHRGLHVLVKYGNAFSAGIFLTMGIVHLMPEASQSFERLYGQSFVATYHPGELLVIAGYALILALQRVVFPTPTCPHALGGGGGDDHGHDHQTSSHHHTRAHACVAGGEHDALLPSATGTATGQGRVAASTQHPLYGTAAPAVPQPVVTVLPSVQKMVVAAPCCRSGKHCVDAATTTTRSGGVSPLGLVVHLSSGHSDSASDPTAERGDVPSPPVVIVEAEHLLLDRSERIATRGAGWTLLLALSVHAVCEGLAVGLQCGVRNVAVLASAVCAHKWAESFALSNSLMHEAVAPHHHPSGVSYTEIGSCQGSFADGSPSGGVLPPEHTPFPPPQDNALAVEANAIERAWRIVIAFACATPVGVLLGALMHSQLPPASAGVVKALSAGTFMYIGASEVVVEEFVQGKQYWGKWLCFVLGVAVMYGLNTVFGH